MQATYKLDIVLVFNYLAFIIHIEHYILQIVGFFFMLFKEPEGIFLGMNVHVSYKLDI